MKYLSTIAFLAVAALFLSSTAGVNAQEEKCDKCPSSKTTTVSTEAKCPCAGDSCSTCEEGECKSCPVTEAMAKLPKMTYRVGKESICCADSAATLAKEKKTPLHYVVGDKVFEEKSKAFVSLVEQTEAMVNEFVTPCKCETSGVTKIAGATCACPVEAGKTSELVSTAVSKVKMTYAVGDESCCCPTQAGELAKSSGEEMTYVVGETKTCCNMTARLNLATAKYKAAVKAMAAAKAKAPATEKAAASKG